MAGTSASTSTTSDRNASSPSPKASCATRATTRSRSRCGRPTAARAASARSASRSSPTTPPTGRDALLHAPYREHTGLVELVDLAIRLEQADLAPAQRLPRKVLERCVQEPALAGALDHVLDVIGRGGNEALVITTGRDPLRIAVIGQDPIEVLP